MMHYSKMKQVAVSGLVTAMTLFATPVFGQSGTRAHHQPAEKVSVDAGNDHVPPRITAITPQTGTRLVDNVGISTLEIQFDELVIVPEGSVIVTGLATGPIGIDEQFFDDQTLTLTLTIDLDQTVRADVLTVVVDYSVVDSAGNPLDGEIAQPVAPSFPSGDNAAGGQAVIRYEVLQGDVDRNGIVEEVDGEIIRDILGESVGSPSFDARADLNNDGFINVLDVAIWANGLGGNLPTTDGVPPSVLSFTPDPALMLMDSLSVLSVQFSEAVLGTGDLARSLYAVSSTGQLYEPTSASMGVNGDSVDFVFDPPLPQCDVYEVRVSNSLTDLSGSNLVLAPYEEFSGFIQPGNPTISPINEFSAASSISIDGAVANAVVVEVVAPSGTQIVDVTNGLYEADINLLSNRLNNISVTAISSCGTRSSPRSVQVIQDNEAPDVFIDFPAADSLIQADTTDVAGRVSDRLSGSQGLQVLINGQVAEVDIGIGTNGTFFLQGIPINSDGTTDIVVQATDMLGNTGDTQISVQRLVIPPNTPMMEIVTGNGQVGQVQQLLPEPITVQMLRGDGSPFSGKVVTFKVTRSNGKLAGANDEVGSMMYQAITDSQGYAEAYWTLGSDAGCGNNRVSVTSRDIAGTIIYCASAAPAGADRILVGDMNNQRAETGAELPEPLRVWVSDGSNGIAGIQVAFNVTRGDGVFLNGQAETSAITDSTGHIDMPFILGTSPGQNKIEATFDGNEGIPATFFAIGLERDFDLPTMFVGTVLDNANRPLGNARVELHVNNLPAGEVFTNVDGEFEFVGIPDGLAHVLVDGTTANSLASEPIPANTFPFVGYDLSIVPNAVNRLPQPALLPEKNINNQFIYDGTQTVQLLVEGIEGLEFTVHAGTVVTLSDGTIVDGVNGNSVALSLDQVHFDKIPMPLPDGAAFPFAWTLQPKAAKFNPPVAVTMPNMAGLDPGAIAYILQWDGEVEQFVIAASGQVSNDGSSIVSDPGEGISVAGWGAATPPVPNTGTLETCNVAPNGCGPSGDSFNSMFLSAIIPNGFNFSEDGDKIYVPFDEIGCNPHDTCYGTSGADKDACDLMFLGNLLSGCFNNFASGDINRPTDFRNCNEAAYIYYRAMSTEDSMRAFMDAQSEAERCDGRASTAEYVFENQTSAIEPPFSDFDLDGIEDEWEILNGLSPLDPTDIFLDPDMDGVLNIYEFAMGFSPNQEDSDSNGISDGIEIVNQNPMRENVIDSSWIINIAGQEIQSGPFGRFESPNISVTGQPIRVYAQRDHDFYGKLYAASNFVTVQDQQSFGINTFEFSNQPFPLPLELLIDVGDPNLQPGMTTEVTVVGRMSDGTQVPLQAFEQGTVFTSSSPEVATVDGEGMVTAISDGVAFISVSNQGRSHVVRINVFSEFAEATVNGVVTFADGVPVEGAEVTSLFGGSTTTDSLGAFSLFIDKIPTGQSISVSASFEFNSMMYQGVSSVLEVDSTLVDAGIIVVNGSFAGPLFPGQKYLVNSGAEQLALGDFDGDDFVDVVTVNTSDDTISILFNTQESQLTDEITLQAGDGPSWAVVEDFDNDGDADIIICNYNSNDLSIYINNSFGQFTNTEQVDVGSRPIHISSSDVDADNDLDLIVVNQGSNSVTVMSNIGGGQFVEASSTPVGAGPNYAVSADFDGDDDMDVIVVETDNDSVSILYNNGMGDLSRDLTYAANNFPLYMDYGDINNDGDLDFVVTSDGTAVVFQNRGNGTFFRRFTHSVGGGRDRVFLADIDQDNDLDIVSDSTNTKSIIVLYNIGNGNSNTSDEIDVGYRSEDTVLGDFNNDGNLDVVTILQTATFAREIAVLFGESTGQVITLDRYESFPAATVTSIAFGDMNNDGYQDIIAMVGGVFSEEESTLAVFWGGDLGSFTQVYSSIVPGNANQIRIGDMDLDGKEDIVVYGLFNNNNYISIYFNTVQGFLFQQLQVPASVGQASLDLGDVDGNKTLDIVYGNSANGITIIKNSGNREFQQLATYNLSGFIYSLQIVDIDNDSDLDIVSALDASDEVSILYNDGNGVYGGEIRYAVGDGPDGIRAGDIDSDGDLDLVIKYLNDRQFDILLNTTKGEFSSRVEYPTNARLRKLEIEDLDLDGDIDIVFTGQSMDNSYHIGVASNNGDGTFGNIRRYISGDNPSSIAVADIDNDSDIDVASGNFGSEDIIVLRNQHNRPPSTLIAGGHNSWKHAGSRTHFHTQFNGPGENPKNPNRKKSVPIADIMTAPVEPLVQKTTDLTSPRIVKVDATDLSILNDKQAQALLEKNDQLDFEASLKNAQGQRVEARQNPVTGLISTVLIDFDGLQRQLPKLVAESSDYPVAINERGDVIGVSESGEAWVWRYVAPDGIESIGSFGGSGSVASFWLGLVAVLGQADLPDGDVRAILWTPGDALLDLSKLVADRHITLDTVLGVMPDGVVIASGLDKHGDRVIVSMALVLSESVVGDIDGNGTVDEMDVRLVMELVEAQNPVGDLNLDGLLDTKDVGVVIRNLGQSSTVMDFESSE